MAFLGLLVGEYGYERAWRVLLRPRGVHPAKAVSSRLLSREPRLRSCSSAAAPAAVAMCLTVSGHFSTQTYLH